MYFSALLLIVSNKLSSFATSSRATSMQKLCSYTQSIAKQDRKIIVAVYFSSKHLLYSFSVTDQTKKWSISVISGLDLPSPHVPVLIAYMAMQVRNYNTEHRQSLQSLSPVYRYFLGMFSDELRSWVPSALTFTTGIRDITYEKINQTFFLSILILRNKFYSMSFLAISAARRFNNPCKSRVNGNLS